MDEQQFMEQTGKVMSDQTPLEVHISIGQAWILVSAVQFTIRNPMLSQPMKDALEATARQFQDRICDAHPEVQTLIEMGWNPEFDV